MTVNSDLTVMPTGRVAWGVPLYASIPAPCVTHLLNHLAYAMSRRQYGVISLVEGAYVDHARNTIVRAALQAANADILEGNTDTVTHLFFQDQDVIVPEDVVPRLLAHNLPVVGAVYYGRDQGHLPVAFDLEPFRRIETFNYDGLNKVGGIGMGATLISLDLLRQIRDDGRWNTGVFGETADGVPGDGNTWWYRCTESNDTEGRRTGEDIWFANICRELGVPVFLDGAARCGHAGIQIITHDHYLAAQEQKAIDAFRDRHQRSRARQPADAAQVAKCRCGHSAWQHSEVGATTDWVEYGACDRTDCGCSGFDPEPTLLERAAEMPDLNGQAKEPVR